MKFGIPDIKIDPNVIRVYDMADAPAEATFLYEKTERNGILDLSVKNCRILGINEKPVYFFRLPS